MSKKQANAASAATAQPRASKATRWRAGVLIGFHVLAAVHIAHWLSTGRTVSPLEPSEAMEFAKHSRGQRGADLLWADHHVDPPLGALVLRLGLSRGRAPGSVPGATDQGGHSSPAPAVQVDGAASLAAAFYMFFWPLIYRLYIEDPLAVRQVAMSKEGFWDTFPTWGPAILTFFVAGFVAVYFLGAKGFCTYACPYGAVFGVADRLAPGAFG